MKHWGLNDNIFEHDTIHITLHISHIHMIYENYNEYADILYFEVKYK